MIMPIYPAAEWYIKLLINRYLWGEFPSQIKALTVSIKKFRGRATGRSRCMYLGILNLCLDLAKIFLLRYCSYIVLIFGHISLWMSLLRCCQDVIYTKISRVSVKQITLHNGFIEWTLLNQPVLSASLEWN